MNSNVQDYILSGLTSVSEKKEAKKQLFCIFGFYLLTDVYPCLSLKGKWIIPFIVTLVSLLFTSIVVYCLTQRGESVLCRLVTQTIIGFEWNIVVSFCGVIYYSLFIGVDIWLILFLASVFIVPMIFGTIN